MPNKKQIFLGISDGISAYKMPNLTQALVKSSHAVKVHLTKVAKNFVPLLTFTRYLIPHISLIEWADLFVLCPATASTLH